MKFFISVSSKKKIVLLANDQEILGKKTWETSGNEAAELMPALMGLLSDHGVTWDSVTKIILVTGPGSFTGLRVAVSVVNALKYSYPYLTCIPVTVGDVFSRMYPGQDSYLFQVYGGDVFLFDAHGVFVDKYQTTLPLPFLGKGMKFSGEIMENVMTVVTEVGVTWHSLDMDTLSFPIVEELAKLQPGEGVILPFYGKGANITMPKVV